MGLFSSITHALFGGSSSKSSSKNLAYPWAQETFAGPAATGAGGIGAYADILGLNGPGAGDEALQNYWKSTGGDFLLNQGTNAVNSNFYSRGLGESGAAMKGLEQYRQDLASTKLDAYLGHLADLSRLGLGAGALVTGAGQVSSGKSDSETGGLGKAVGALLSFASDPRLKTNVCKVGELPDGLGVYDFDYLPGHGLPEGRFRGVMADEVARLQPWALGPEVNGYATVYYGRLEAR